MQAEQVSIPDPAVMGEQRILLVEDEATTREIITHVLRQEGYAVDSVANAGAASTCLQSISYALVIADWLLPDGNGLDIADAAANLGAKTLIISGYTSDPPPGSARHDFLTKPVAQYELLGAVRTAIGEPPAPP
jgi:DNA-binding response OmpR family regulator